MNLFDMGKPRYTLNQPVRLFESFSGIGTQAMALKRLGVEIEHVGISEIDKHAIASYMAIHGDVKNYGNIMDIKGSDLGEIDLFTWSFPCTDLSKAGKQKGLDGTRSGLGYQVIRIIGEMEVKPKVLLMENVPDLLSEKFKEGWREMYHDIEKMGYTNYVEILNAKNYGVAQNRERVFMVSILGDYSYEFPQGFKLEKRLKDYLEDEVDEKYYLSEKMFNYVKSRMPSGNNKLTTGINIYNKNENALAGTVCTSGGNQPSDNFIIENENIVYDKQIGNIKTIEPKCLNSKVNGKQPSLQDRIYDTKEISTAITTSFMPSIENNLRIRKLTPLECWRLMGISDEDFYKAQKVCSNSQLYKQAGNAICVPVLENIFKEII